LILVTTNKNWFVKFELLSSLRTNVIYPLKVAFLKEKNPQ